MRRYTFQIAGRQLTTPAGDFWGFVCEQPDEDGTIGPSIFSQVDRGMVVFHFTPLTPRQANPLEAEMRAAQMRGEPPSVVEAYREIIQSLSGTTQYACVSMSGLVQGNPPSQWGVPLLPNLAAPVTTLSPLSKRWQLICPTKGLADTIVLPTHVGYGWTPVGIGGTADGMAAYIDWGSSTTARHVVLCGRTRTGKSTATKLAVERTARLYPEFHILVFDLKGEYSRSEGGESVSLFGGSVIGPGDGPTPGEMTLNAGPEREEEVAQYESWLIRSVLDLLGRPTVPNLERLLIQAARKFREAGESPQMREKILRAVYEHIREKAKIQPHSDADTVLGGALRPKNRPPVDQPGVVVCNLSRCAYGSPFQRASFVWLVGGIVPLVAPQVRRRRILVVEEFYMLIPEVLDTLLRTAAGRGVSAVFVTQSDQDLKRLEGAGEQFACAIYMCPGITQVWNLARLYGITSDHQDLFPLAHQNAIRRWASRPHGWGVMVTPGGIVALQIDVPPDFLKRIDEFNEQRVANTQGPTPI